MNCECLRCSYNMTAVHATQKTLLFIYNLSRWLCEYSAKSLTACSELGELEEMSPLTTANLSCHRERESV